VAQLRERLEALEQTLADVGSPLLDHLRPGVSADAVTAALASRGVEPHPDLLTWFGWHDGTDLPRAVDPPGALLPDDGNRLIGGLHLPGLDEALVEYDAEVALERKHNPEPQEPMFHWPGWFPVLDFTEQKVCVDAAGAVGPAGILFVFDVWVYDPPRPFFPSLTALVDAVIDTYRTGRVSPTQLVIDPAVLPASAKALHY
jgi:hypothetical protein